MLTWKYGKELSRFELVVGGEKLLLRIVQEDIFSDDISAIREHGHVAKTSKLFKFSPFLDEEDLLRIGGRLQESPFDFEEKHRVLLGKHHVGLALIRHYHKKKGTRKGSFVSAAVRTVLDNY